jgi:PAS domain S-box-containing protein
MRHVTLRTMRRLHSPTPDTPSTDDPVELLSEAERIARFGIWKWEIASGRVHWSDELHRIYGLRPGEFDGTVDAFIERVHPDERDRVWASISASVESLEPFVFEERIVRADGAERTLVSQGRVIVDAEGVAAVLVGVCHDVTERATVERALGTSERRMRAIIDNTPSLITVKDLDGRYLMSNAEAERMVGLAPGGLTGKQCTDVFPPPVAESQRVNDRRAASEAKPVYDQAVLIRDGEERTYMTVTFALPDEHGDPAETCTIATDVTERKERDGERRDRLEWTERITSALNEDRLPAFAQPIVNLETGDHASSELLARMRAPGAGSELALPETFLPAAERYGLVQPIDVLMVGRALELAPRTPAQVNVSAVTMGDPVAREQIAALLAGAPEAARRVVFEITETADPVDLEAAREFAEIVTRAGARLALDDFGVGFGSFTYLRSLPLSFIKIDRAFVGGLVDSPDDRHIVKSTIEIAREFGLWTIAEGVEDSQTLELLKSLGADFAQGFHLGRPAPLGGP